MPPKEAQQPNKDELEFDFDDVFGCPNDPVLFTEDAKEPIRDTNENTAQGRASRTFASAPVNIKKKQDNATDQFVGTSFLRASTEFSVFLERQRKERARGNPKPPKPNSLK